jgi:hypothetical protein
VRMIAWHSLTLAAGHKNSTHSVRCSVRYRGTPRPYLVRPNLGPDFTTDGLGAEAKHSNARCSLGFVLLQQGQTNSWQSLTPWLAPHGTAGAASLHLPFDVQPGHRFGISRMICQSSPVHCKLSPLLTVDLPTTPTSMMSRQQRGATYPSTCIVQ